MTIQVVRWIARIGAGLTAVFILFLILAHAITDGAAPLQYLTARETAMMAAFAAVWIEKMASGEQRMASNLQTRHSLLATRYSQTNYV